MENETKFMEPDNVQETSNYLVAALFALHTRQNNNVLETLAASFYAVEKFRAAVVELGVIPSEACAVIEEEMKRAAREDMPKELVEKLKILLDESQKGE